MYTYNKRYDSKFVDIFLITRHYLEYIFKYKAH